jgi:hypothetical protein
MLRSGIKAVIACAALVAAACSPQADVAKSPGANASAGKTFGVILHAPPDWHVLSDEELKEIRNTTADAILGDDPELRRMAEASQQAGTVIFTAFRYAPDAAVDDNPSVQASAASVAEAPDMTARGYLRNAIIAMHALGAKMMLDGDFRSREIDGQVFDFTRIHLDSNGGVVTQDYYAARHGDDMINIVQTYAYADEAQRLETDKVVSAIELDW